MIEAQFPSGRPVDPLSVAEAAKRVAASRLEAANFARNMLHLKPEDPVLRAQFAIASADWQQAQDRANAYRIEARIRANRPLSALRARWKGGQFSSEEFDEYTRLRMEVEQEPVE